MSGIGATYTEAPGPWAANPERACAQPGVDPEIFFPDRGGSAGRDADEARAICYTCPVLDECRDYALAQPISALFGIWGGLTGDERRHAKRQPRKAA